MESIRLIRVNQGFIDLIKKHKTQKPFIDLQEIFESLSKRKYIIHNLYIFIEKLVELDIRYIKIKDDYLYLIASNNVYRYAYGYPVICDCEEEWNSPPPTPDRSTVNMNKIITIISHTSSS